jgi:nucleotide-binding universal stress UspA family protein
MYKLLVAVDSSTYSYPILDAVCRLKLQTGALVHILTVVSTTVTSEVSEQYMRQCQYILSTRVKRVQARLPNCKVSGECLLGSPATAIVEVASQRKSDLIVIGSHGDTGVRPANMSDIAGAIVNHAPCSVMILKLHHTRDHSSVETEIPYSIASACDGPRVQPGT